MALLFGSFGSDHTNLSARSAISNIVNENPTISHEMAQNSLINFLSAPLSLGMDRVLGSDLGIRVSAPQYPT